MSASAAAHSRPILRGRAPPITGIHATRKSALLRISLPNFAPARRLMIPALIPATVLALTIPHQSGDSSGPGLGERRDNVIMDLDVCQLIGTICPSILPSKVTLAGILVNHYSEQTSARLSLLSIENNWRVADERIPY